MCGIAGIISPENDHWLKAQTQAMIRVMDHRGPDGQGIYCDGPACIGHRRLSIIDLEGGKQPMSNEDNTVWITFNGEIYNFIDLKKDLENKGHVFRNKSDTEAIVHAYEEYGEECVKKLRGMFAFGLWDSNKRQFFLARDRLGKKPLYYFYDGRRLIFASEIKSILQVDGVDKTLDISALTDYFTYMYIPFPKTIFKNIYKLPPAHTLRTKQIGPNGKLELSIKEYWDLNYLPDYSRSEESWLEALEEKILEAVKIRLISDVPLGAFLSGGIDSSAVVAMMSQVDNQPVKTFSIGFEDIQFSELEYARQVAQKYNTDHHEMIVKPDAIEILPKLAWQFDEPFADSSALPTYYVSKMTRQNVTVALSGDGGDEVFAGYEKYSAFLRYQKADLIPDKIRKMIFGGLSDAMPFGMRGKGIIRHISESSFARFAGMVTQTSTGVLDNLFHRDLKHQINVTYDFLDTYYRRFCGNDDLSRLQYMETKTYLAEDILTKVDRASMLCSLETRAPLLDHELLELVATIPSDLKLKNGEKKYILKKLMVNYLPENIIYRKKKGFNIPLSKWFKADFNQYARDLLLSATSSNRGIFNTTTIERILDTHSKKGRNLSDIIWALLFFESWCRQWLD